MTKDDNSFSPYYISISIFVISILISVFFSKEIHNKNQFNANSIVEQNAEKLGNRIKERLTIYQHGLRGTRGQLLTQGIDNTKRELFLHYVQSRNISSEFPGSRGIGFIRRVPMDQEADFLKLAKTDVDPNFEIKQFAPHQKDRFVVLYIEPILNNLQSIGLDIGSEKIRRFAAEEAMKFGKATITAPITLVQLSGKARQSFLLLVPIYRSWVTPDSEEKRIKECVGWAYSPLWMEEVLVNLPTDPDLYYISIRDVDEYESNPFFTNDKNFSSSESLFSQEIKLEIFGRNWQLNYSVKPKFITELNQINPMIVFLFGCGLSTLLAILAHTLGLNYKNQQVSHQQKAQLASLVESAPDAIIGIMPNGLVTSWNKSAEFIFGYRVTDTIGKNLEKIFFSGNDSENLQELLKDLNQGKTIDHYITTWSHLDGHYIDISISAAPLFERRKIIGASIAIRDITNQKAAEALILSLNLNLENQVKERTEELQNTNRLLVNLLNSATDSLIIQFDLKGIILIFNSGAENILGYKSKDLVDKKLFLIFPSKEEVCLRAIELSNELSRPIDDLNVFITKPKIDGSEIREWNFIHADGRQIPILLSITPVRNLVDEITGYLGIGNNISERKLAEQALIESENRYNMAFSGAGVGLWDWNLKNNTIYFSPVWKRMLGYLDNEVENSLQAWKSFWHPDDMARIETSIEDYIQGKTSKFEIKYRMKHKEGNWHWIISCGDIFNNKNGKPERWVGSNIDITSFTKLEEELKSTSNRLSLALQTSSIGIWEWDIVNNKLVWDDQMFALYHLKKENFKGDFNTWVGTLHPEDIENINHEIQKALNGEKNLNIEYRIIWSDQSIHTLRAMGTIIRDEIGKPSRMLGTNWDISHQKVTEQKALAASEAKSAFLATMSHEIRTPMNGALGMLNLLLQTDLNSRQFDYAEKAQISTKALLGIINSILDFSKIESGKMILEHQSFELESLLRQLSVLLSGNLGEKELEILFAVDKNIPPILIGDELRLLQILLNLASNAIKFTDQGEVVLSVNQLSRKSNTVTLEFIVSDTGIGIPPDKINSIFEDFSQAESSTTRRYGGTGLGLTISSRLAKMMNSTLNVTSELRKGSKFSFIVDFEIDLNPQTIKRLKTPSKMRVLAVDDNDIAREIIQNIASSLGWECDIVSSGTEAIQLLTSESQPYQLVLLDWSMPVLDGLETAKRINKLTFQGTKPNIIMITAHEKDVFKSNHEKDLHLLNGFLVKPVTGSMLYDAVLDATQDHEKNRQNQLKPTIQKLRGLRLLVVEDNLFNQQIAQELLTSAGAIVEMASGGIIGVSMALKTPAYDAILMDIQMPDIDGYEATRRIKNDKIGKSIPVIAITANAMISDKQACLEAGMVDHISKPIDINELIYSILLHTKKTTIISNQTFEGQLPFNNNILIDAKNAIERLGDEELYLQVKEMFCIEAPQQLLEANTYFKEGNFSDAARCLHSLKGFASTIGANSLHTLVAKAEAYLKSIPANNKSVETNNTFIHLLEDVESLLTKVINEISNSNNNNNHSG